MIFAVSRRRTGQLLRPLMTPSNVKLANITRKDPEIVEEKQQVWLKQMHKCMPSLTSSLHKGQSGRIGIVGGCDEYTGAPYYSSMTALRCGADLAHIFCTPSAAPVLKSYGPEAIVHGILRGGSVEKEAREWLPRLHCLVIGPGLGRDAAVLESASSIIRTARDMAIPLVVDADGLWLALQNPDLVSSWPNGKIVLTPNVMEFSRLASKFGVETVEDVANAFQGTVLLKSKIDYIASPKGDVVVCGTGGSGRRCGGQGDVLSGALGVFLNWACQHEHNDGTAPYGDPTLVAAYGASRLVRECNMLSFTKNKRSTLTVDMLSEIHNAFANIFEGE
ncbi:ATP-dependent (S)-NAD(P)H-hydrate dehydratase [Ischnura elegans]|uniref:ATP-dependent (S)-NAD(P)H-hydrate dehydratase n=1 Tax=Ischnura elegans TaxID=197161 RepID=UPI001ED8752C|nr:ATP-dependent (S)-NAD(P)H-hydrate dehydratase [Ischnura elegans]XP_046400823.1 ATP-dependent (S)-NAD(P)H-hydrate dehydratase [Ischnura elegans]